LRGENEENLEAEGRKRGKRRRKWNHRRWPSQFYLFATPRSKPRQSGRQYLCVELRTNLHINTGEKDRIGSRVGRERDLGEQNEKSVANTRRGFKTN